VNTLSGQVAVVTGAASGIGRALTLELGSRGCDVALIDLDAERLRPIVEAVEAAGRRATAHGMDVGDRGAWQQLVPEVLTAHGHVDLVINNAGVAVTGPFEDTSDEDLEWLININLWGVVSGTRAFLPHMRERRMGHIVNLSSIFGIVGMPNNAIYCASKFAVRGLTEALAAELHGSGIHFTSVHPGAVATAIAKTARFYPSDKLSHRRAIKMIAKGIPPSLAAQQILDGVAAHDERIVVGTDAKILALLPRLMPVGYRSILRWGDTLLRRRSRSAR
jgi:short-subunit dehydrogenase